MTNVPTPTGAALPWAQAPAADANANAAAPQQTTVKAGDRIEVRWLVEPSDGEPYAKWWGARVERAAAAAGQAADETATAAATAAAADSSGGGDNAGGGVVSDGPAFVIAYDPEEGFAPEERRVQLLTEHDLYDLTTNEELHWRRAGDSWEPPAGDDDDEDGSGSGGSDDDDGDAAADQAGGVFAALDALAARPEATLGEIDRALPAEGAMRAAEAAALEGLDAAAQRRVAAGFREYVDCFKQYIGDRLAAAAAAGEEFVVTEAVVRDFKAAAAARRARVRDGGGGGGGEGGGAADV